MAYLGDIAEDATIRGSFNSRDSDGAPITLAGTPSLAVYKDAGTTEITAGITLTVDFDSVTGLHLYTIDTSASADYSTGSDYRVVIAAGTVDAVSVVGVEVGSFSIENRYMRGTNSAASQASVDTIDGIVDSILADTNELQTNQNNWLTATGFSTHSAADVLTALGTGTWATAIPWNAAWDAEVQSEVNDALVALDLDSALIAQGAVRSVNVDVSHRVHSHVYDMQANTLTASALAADAVAEIQSGLATSAELPTDFDTLVITDGKIAGIAGTINTLDALDTAQDTQHTTSHDRLGYVLASLAGACADAGTAAETYAITIGADTFTIDHTGLDSTGNRGTAVLTKS